jgi:hypothetical protein
LHFNSDYYKKRGKRKEEGGKKKEEGGLFIDLFIFHIKSGQVGATSIDLIGFREGWKPKNTRID